MWLSPLARLRAGGGGEDVGQRLADVAHLLSFAFCGSLTELRDFGHDETALCLGQVGLLEIVEMGWDNVLLPVQEPIAGCFLRFLVDVREERVNLDLSLTDGFVIGLVGVSGLRTWFDIPSR